jgi:DNA-binding transcriptional ArsR family regulator
MDLNTAANALRELGHPTRLSIYRELVRAGHEGLPVGELQKHLEIPASTLSHHLSALISAGLISQERQSRTLFCRPCYAQLEQLMGSSQKTESMVTPVFATPILTISWLA